VSIFEFSYSNADISVRVISFFVHHTKIVKSALALEEFDISSTRKEEQYL
jgi:hypothetical protein